MEGENIRIKTFEFPEWERPLKIQVGMNGDIVFTHKYCPQEFLTDALTLYPGVNGEKEEDFVRDCRHQIIGMSLADCESTLLDRHIAGLMAVVLEHFSRVGHLDFPDLLIYMDIFSLLLEADGFPEAEIRDIYPRVTSTILSLYEGHILSLPPP